jgi:ParB/RepB/Spo0J family partition protein
MTTSMIPIDQIVPNPEQPRKSFDPAETAMLAESIRQHGLINPISVEANGDHYILIDGERRWKAAKIAGLTEIEASIRTPMNGSGSTGRLTLALVANIQRSDMTPVEEGQAFTELNRLGHSVEEISQMVGLAKSNVYTRMRLLELDSEIQELYAAGKLPLHSQMIAAIQGVPAEHRVRLLRSLSSKNMTMAGMISICKRAGNGTNHGGHRTAPVREHGEKWDMLKQIGDDPRLARYREVAKETCRICPIYDMASPSSCRDCPAVDLLKRIALRTPKGVVS